MPGRRRILIVEDDVDLRQMFATWLKFAGYDVQQAGDGLEALRLIDGQPPHAVVLDLGLPLISGQVVRQEIAAQAQTRDIPVIVVTAQPGSHDHLKVACVLTKPVLPDDLVDVVGRCLASGAQGLRS
ncbi:MAG: response regulator [Acidobacteria bacterium]|nr:MAG: response regulator [Acidobacteriota bacterium]